MKRAILPSSLLVTTASALLLSLLWLLPTACSDRPNALPDHSTPISEQPQVYPDYTAVVVPPNIAPLNVQVKNAGSSFVLCYEGGGKQLIAGAGADGKVDIDSIAWRGLLQASKGHAVKVTVYAHRDRGWVKLSPFTFDVAAEPIDKYLSYRLIEPSYELYRQLGLYQRDLEGFAVSPIYENNREFDNQDNHCINCHNYQDYSTRRMLFHVRSKHGGTVFVDNGKPVKLNMKTDSILSSTVYPTWHPTRNWVVFSSNQTGQIFHMVDPQKIEVVDYGSDLVFYDADKQELTNILKSDDTMETFPCWAPDGRKLYYCSAHTPDFAGKTATQRQDLITGEYDKVRYNLMSLTFDPATRTFGTPTIEVDCAAMGKSCAVPRISPDGRYCLFTLSDFGQFHIWHKSADLYIKDLRTGEVYPLAATNSDDVDSYHTWSSNGRWMVFSSRRDDGSFTRPYIAYFDKEGKGHKAFILPQQDPEQNLLLTKSYNVPELTRDAVRISHEELKKCIYDDAAIKQVKYRK